MTVVSESCEAVKCLVISDGRRGIENQALGLAEACAALQPLSIQTQHIQHNTFVAALPPGLQLRVARFELPECDIAIGCGRQAIAPLLKLKRDNPAIFTVYIQDPRISPDAFDLVIAPEHDGLNGPNVINMIGSPNRVTETRIIGETLKFAAGLAKLPSPKTAFLIGGTSKTHMLTPDDHASHLAHAKTLYAAGHSLLITTSRRTPDFAREAWTDFASESDRIWLYDGNGPNPYFAFLGAADLILVTEDSTNMLTEACGTGKPVYRLQMSGKAGKFQTLYGALELRCDAVSYTGQLSGADFLPLDETTRAAQELWNRFKSSP
ncbi:mitochondrial fission ELM1 family protein [Litorimonas sp. WD9-15]|uniref:mitochondrial fission ELM1 family protein n=1 Tax=Litorimonas sp. WD9-15 TaxID=3418716 RepID=UPI003D06F975